MIRSWNEKDGYSDESRRKLTAQEINVYRQKLAELDEAAHQQGGDLLYCPPKLRKVFMLNHETGRQIYRSYTDEELLDIYNKYRQRRESDYKMVVVLYCIYKDYICKRFGNLDNARKLARVRDAIVRYSPRYPADWHEHVSAEAGIAYIESCGKQPSEQDKALLRQLCEQVKRTGFPPELTTAEKKQYNICDIDHDVLWREMGIPVLGVHSLKVMKEYWTKERGKTAVQTTVKG